MGYKVGSTDVNLWPPPVAATRNGLTFLRYLNELFAHAALAWPLESHNLRKWSYLASRERY